MAFTNKEMPHLLQTTVDMKGLTIESMKETMKAIGPSPDDVFSLPSEPKLLFITNFGLIKGNFIDLRSIEDGTSLGEEDFTRILYKSVLVARDEHIKGLEKTKDPDRLQLINGASTFYLEDVTLIPFANPSEPIRYTGFILFASDVTGVKFILEEEE